MLKVEPEVELPGVVLLSGPTAVGKSAVALEVARACKAEIINGDSLQVYRYLDIGTAKPDLAERNLLPHHLFDILDPDQSFNATDFQARADVVIADIRSRGRLPLVVGGTGLYLRALLFGLCQMPEIDLRLRAELEERLTLEGSEALHAELARYDAPLAARLAPRDRTRVLRALETVLATGQSLAFFQERHRFLKPRYRFLHLYLDLEREKLYQRINQRVETMLAQGFVDEVKGLLEKGFSAELKPLQSIGYRQINEYLAGSLSLERAVSETKQATRRYAKRQLTWFRNDPHAVGIAVSDWKKILLRIDEFTIKQTVESASV
ncbi:MAG: tRNA (adenosine(37)-N6)-dimethylallyltransferase MiaA [Deltaproteobacteria bacterium]|nr:tRNA (adenosine(37)-N6)-dimethylallyltransferase MiaA [Deltaproteobacteria bacterium]